MKRISGAGAEESDAAEAAAISGHAAESAAEDAAGQGGRTDTATRKDQGDTVGFTDLISMRIPPDILHVVCSFFVLSFKFQNLSIACVKILPSLFCPISVLIFCMRCPC